MKWGIMVDGSFEGNNDDAANIIRKLLNTFKELNIKTLKISVFEEEEEE